MMRYPVLDPAVPYPNVATLRQALAARDWPACRAVLDAAPSAERTFLTSVAADVEGGRKAEPGPYVEHETAAFLRAVLWSNPADGAAGALLGQHLIDRAWAVRTSYGASAVSRERFASFHEILRMAEQVLTPAAAAAPDDPAIWVARLTAARGLQMGQAEALRRYDRLAKIDPHHLPGQTQLLQQLAPKWGGTWEALHAFSRDAARAAPPGAPHAMLIVQAHLERWMDIRGIRIGTANAYLRSEPVRTEIEQAAHQSVWHPEFRRTYGWLEATNTFAVAYCLLGDMRSAKTLFRRLGGLGTEFPWEYVFPSATVVMRWYRMRSLLARAR
ncbi:hypothetical protein AB0F81_13875 [Actinoplanes sp. NPDC024001]|uniref:hypothetical protein n=1 Tax=Actinoplanes sp. NPDC024001 TaxID=3154598 RepID=UPI0033DA8512